LDAREQNGFLIAVERLDHRYERLGGVDTLLLVDVGRKRIGDLLQFVAEGQLLGMCTAEPGNDLFIGQHFPAAQENKALFVRSLIHGHLSPSIMASVMS